MTLVSFAVKLPSVDEGGGDACQLGWRYPDVRLVRSTGPSPE